MNYQEKSSGVVVGYCTCYEMGEDGHIWRYGCKFLSIDQKLQKSNT